MHYYPVTLSDNIFNNIEELLKYGDMEKSSYSHPQAISRAYIRMVNQRRFYPITMSDVYLL